MNSGSILSIVMMLATTSVFGQSISLLAPLDPSKCPVGLEVEKSGALIAYRNARSGPANAEDRRSLQRFAFKMTNHLPHEIVNVEITARGFSDKLRVLSFPDTKPDLVKTVSVALDVKRDGSATRELSFAGLPIVSTFDLNAITYADGSAWHASSPDACRVAPSAAMLISAR